MDEYLYPLYEHAWRHVERHVGRKRWSVRPPHIIHMSALAEINIERLGVEQMVFAQKLSTNMILSSAEADRLNTILRDQANAIRDYEYMTNHLHGVRKYHERLATYSDLSAPFPKLEEMSGLSLTSDWYRRLPQQRPNDASERLLRSVQAMLPETFIYSKEELELSEFERMGTTPMAYSPTVKLIAGALTALRIAAIIVVPITIMSFNTSRTRILITIAISVTLFGFFAAIALRLKNSGTFIGTATYAAVLVVFVGAGGVS